MEKIDDLVSIIIPFHNGEKYINKCMNSILNQEYKNIEIIFINDGSTDNSINKLKEYNYIAKKDWEYLLPEILG